MQHWTYGRASIQTHKPDGAILLEPWRCI